MKIFRILLCFAVIVTFSGCAVKESAAWEYVTDALPAAATPSYRLEAEVPSGAMLTGVTDSGRAAIFSHTDYEVIEEIFPAASAEDAFLHIAGQSSAQLHPIKLSAEPEEEYRFSWAAVGENGMLTCSAAILLDGEYCYSVCIQCDAEKEQNYRAAFSALLSGISLQEI